MNYRVLWTKCYLLLAGYDPGGRMMLLNINADDPAFNRALRKWQADHGFKANGWLTTEQVNMMHNHVIKFPENGGIRELKAVAILQEGGGFRLEDKIDLTSAKLEPALIAHLPSLKMDNLYPPRAEDDEKFPQLPLKTDDPCPQDGCEGKIGKSGNCSEKGCVFKTEGVFPEPNDRGSYVITDDEGNFGPYSESILRELLSKGHISESTPAKDRDEWLTVGQLLSALSGHVSDCDDDLPDYEKDPTLDRPPWDKRPDCDD